MFYLINRFKFNNIRNSILFLFLFILLINCKEKFPQGKLPENVVPIFYQLRLDIDPSKEEFSGKVNLSIDIKEKLNSFFIHAKDMQIISSSIIDKNGEEIEVTISKSNEDGVALVKIPKILTNSNYNLKIDYTAPFNEHLQGLYKVKDNGEDYIFSQMESIFARYAFPCFDEPGFKTQFQLEVIIPQNLKAVTNTPEEVSELKDGKKKILFRKTKPIPTYLFALAIGDLDIVDYSSLPPNSIRTNSIPLRGVATKGKGKKLNYALENTKIIVETLEQYFQIPYPYEKLDIIAVPDFSFGAMENPGAITYREQFLLLDKDSSYEQKRSYKIVHAHELSHQWFGNLVTPQWWNDIWLNESFATWASIKVLMKIWPKEGWDTSQSRYHKYIMESDSISSARKIRNPVMNNGDILNAFDGITYTKGSAVLTMMESFMGENNFQKGIQNFLNSFKWGNANADQFFESLGGVLKNELSKNLILSFQNFVNQIGVPLISLSYSCEKEKTKIFVEQERYLPLGGGFEKEVVWNLPLCIKYEANGVIANKCHLIKEKKQELELKGCSNWILPNTNAKGYYRFNLIGEGWKDLIKNLEKLQPEESYAVLDSIKASFQSGNLKIEDIFNFIPNTINSPSREVFSEGMSLIENIIENAEESDSTKLKKYFGNLYKEKAESYGLNSNTTMDKNNPLDTSLIRKELINFMAFTIENKDYEDFLAELGVKFIGYKEDEKIHKEGITPNLIPGAMSAAVKKFGKPFVESILKILETENDGTIRGYLITGLSSVEEPELAKILLDKIINKEFRDNERFELLLRMSKEEKLEDYIWTWIQLNFDKLIETIPTNYIPRTPSLVTGNCNPKGISRLENFIKPRISKLPGVEST
ncbi:MAG: M1 family metallopeptidase, partial [Leptospiraceae bacterium]|nr:M1 family metallopeptidase [Leptospiraceae bacterium]